MYYHCALRANGEWTIPPVDTKKKLQEAEFTLANILGEYEEDTAEDDIPW